MTAKATNPAQEDIERINRRLQQLELEKTQLLGQKAALESSEIASVNEPPIVTTGEKVALFRHFFKGRDDIFAFRWENTLGKSGYALACHNEWKPGLCNKPRIKCGQCPHQAYKPLDPKILYDHLSGAQVVGLYPLTKDDACHLLTVDFDKADWESATQAFSAICDALDIPHAIERSRSGNGAHVWIFFENKTPAREARRLGFYLLDKAMESYPALSFDSYDRLFPNQDFAPSGGFGNLIALPLQYQSRQKRNSVFVDSQLTPYPEQWQFLNQLQKLSAQQLNHLLQNTDGGQDRLSQASAQMPALLQQSIARGYVLKTCVRLLNEYLDLYGGDELHAAVTEALEQQAPYPEAVQQILERRREEKQLPPPLAVAVPDKVKHLQVKTLNAADYDSLYGDEPPRKNRTRS